MKARFPMLLFAAVAALALVAHRGAASTASAHRTSAIAAPEVRAPRPPPQLVRDFSADEPVVGDPGLGRFQQAPFTIERPKVPVFTDIGQVADVVHRDATIEGAGTVNMGAAQVPGVGTALKVQAAVEQVMAVVLGTGNAAGLSQQQLDYACPGGKCSANALALAEGRLGTKSVLINGDYVQVGGAALGGPGLRDLAAAAADEQVSLRASSRTLLG